MKLAWLLSSALILPLLGAAADVPAASPISPPETKPENETPAKTPAKRGFRAKEVFDAQQRILFQDDFHSGKFGKWGFSEDDRYGLPEPTPERIRIVDAPGLEAGKKAVRFFVPRAPNSFRAELSLPHENGFQERWYSERIFIPADWVLDPGPGSDIVMQWHAIPGNWRATHPNLAIAINNDQWVVRQNYGEAQTQPTRTSTRLDDPVRRGAWTGWVIHAKWSPQEDGILQIWKDGTLVVDRQGPNVYTTIGVEYTPYLKTGIYRPEWHLDNDRKRQAFEKETPAATAKTIYATEIKVGGANASYGEMAPPQIKP